jgi:hypothetical protein
MTDWTQNRPGTPKPDVTFAILAGIADFRDTYGISPSLDEMRDFAGVWLASKSTVRHHVCTLTEAGYLAWPRGKGVPRGCVVTRAGFDALIKWQNGEGDGHLRGSGRSEGD